MSEPAAASRPGGQPNRRGSPPIPLKRGEPRVAPVDGLLFRGHFWFGSAENSARFRNIRANPAVSGVVTRGLETFLIIVHGRAVEIDPRGPSAEGFAD